METIISISFYCHGRIFFSFFVSHVCGCPSLRNVNSQESKNIVYCCNPEDYTQCLKDMFGKCKRKEGGRKRGKEETEGREEGKKEGGRKGRKEREGGNKEIKKKEEKGGRKGGKGREGKERKRREERREREESHKLLVYFF